MFRTRLWRNPLVDAIKRALPTTEWVPMWKVAKCLTFEQNEEISTKHGGLTTFMADQGCAFQTDMQGVLSVRLLEPSSSALPNKMTRAVEESTVASPPTLPTVAGAAVEPEDVETIQLATQETTLEVLFQLFSFHHTRYPTMKLTVDRARVILNEAVDYLATPPVRLQIDQTVFDKATAAFPAYLQRPKSTGPPETEDPPAETLTIAPTLPPAAPAEPDASEEPRLKDLPSFFHAVQPLEAEGFGRKIVGDKIRVTLPNGEGLTIGYFDDWVIMRSDGSGRSLAPNELTAKGLQTLLRNVHAPPKLKGFLPKDLPRSIHFIAQHAGAPGPTWAEICSLPTLSDDRSKRPVILVAGEAGSGKTTWCCNVLHNKVGATLVTCSSLQAAFGDAAINGIKRADDLRKSAGEWKTTVSEILHFGDDKAKLALLRRFLRGKLHISNRTLRVTLALEHFLKRLAFDNMAHHLEERRKDRAVVNALVVLDDVGYSLPCVSAILTAARDVYAWAYKNLFLNLVFALCGTGTDTFGSREEGVIRGTTDLNPLCLVRIVHASDGGIEFAKNLARIPKDPAAAAAASSDSVDPNRPPQGSVLEKFGITEVQQLHRQEVLAPLWANARLAVLVMRYLRNMDVTGCSHRPETVTLAVCYAFHGFLQLNGLSSVAEPHKGDLINVAYVTLCVMDALLVGRSMEWLSSVETPWESGRTLEAFEKLFPRAVCLHVHG